MKNNLCFFLIFVFIVVFLFSINKKENVYIYFENIPEFNVFKKYGTDSLLQNIEFKQKGEISYQYWNFVFDNKRIEKKQIDKRKTHLLNSQYWIINNYSGFSFEFNHKKMKKYKLFIVEYPNRDSIYIYSVNKVEFITE